MESDVDGKVLRTKFEKRKQDRTFARKTYDKNAVMCKCSSCFVLKFETIDWEVNYMFRFG